jgi:hypothetical protein
MLARSICGGVSFTSDMIYHSQTLRATPMTSLAEIIRTPEAGIIKAGYVTVAILHLVT